VARFITPLPRPDIPKKSPAGPHPPRTDRRRAWAASWSASSPCLIAGVAVLAVLALPATKLQLGLPGGNSQPSSNTAHKAYKPGLRQPRVGFNGPLLVVAGLQHRVRPQDITRIVSRLSTNPTWSPHPQVVANHTAIIQVIPKTGPNASATSTLVKTIRHDEPAIAARTGVHVLVGRTTAANIDTSSKRRAPSPFS